MKNANTAAAPIMTAPMAKEALYPKWSARERPIEGADGGDDRLTERKIADSLCELVVGQRVACERETGGGGKAHAQAVDQPCNDDGGYAVRGAVCNKCDHDGQNRTAEQLLFGKGVDRRTRDGLDSQSRDGKQTGDDTDPSWRWRRDDLRISGSACSS